MRNTFRYSLLLLSVAFIACGDDDSTNSGPCTEAEGCTLAQNTTATKFLLTPGDSRVEGARPSFEAYRYELWKLFQANGHSVDFIGSQTDQACYPAVDGACFDPQHDATGGFTTPEVLGRLQNTTYSNTPDFVTLGIGGNDLLDNRRTPDEAIAVLNQIIDELQTLNDSIVIFLEQIAPGRSDIMTSEFQARFDAYNNQMPELAAAQSTDGQRVIVVDMRPGWSDNLMADEVHYNEAGARLVAERYYSAIDTSGVLN